MYGAHACLHLCSTNMEFWYQLGTFRCIYYSHYWLKHMNIDVPFVKLIVRMTYDAICIGATGCWITKTLLLVESKKFVVVYILI